MGPPLPGGAASHAMYIHIAGGIAAAATGSPVCASERWRQTWQTLWCLSPDLVWVEPRGKTRQVGMAAGGHSVLW